MKLRSKIWTGIGIVLIVSLTLFMMGNQNSKPEEEKTISNAQAESKQERPDGEMETAENGHEGDLVSENNGHEQTEADKKQEQHAQTEPDANQEQMKVEENHTVVNEAFETSTPSDKEAKAPSTGSQPAGLYFSSREEAVAFGFSRFTAEEIAIYNRAAESGLTSEQEEMALQIAYSRFSPEEISAIEEALGR